MLDALPYADLLAIHNALAEKPARRFDTRTNGERRTATLMEERGLTLADAARLADVVLAGDEPSGEATTPDKPTPTSDEDGGPALKVTHGPVDGGSTDDDAERVVTLTGSDIRILAALVFGDESGTMTEDEVTSMLQDAAAVMEKLRAAPLAKPARAPKAKRTGAMTSSQQKIVELCARPEGATGKELAEGCGWPSIAARATCQKLADRFGYTLEENPKANGRGISFRMSAKPELEA
jgi:hypothetical protein